MSFRAQQLYSIDLRPEELVVLPRGLVLTPERHRAQQAFASRLRTVFRDYGRKKLTEEIPCSPGAVRKWFAGLSDPKRWYLVRICEITGCSLEWLASGIGPKYPSDSYEPRKHSFLPVQSQEVVSPIRGLVVSRSWISATFGSRPGRLEAHYLRTASQQVIAIVATDQRELDLGWFLVRVDGVVKLLHYDPQRADVLSEPRGQTKHGIDTVTTLGRAVFVLRTD